MLNVFALHESLYAYCIFRIFYSIFLVSPIFFSMAWHLFVVSPLSSPSTAIRYVDKRMLIVDGGTSSSFQCNDQEKVNTNILYGFICPTGTSTGAFLGFRWIYDDFILSSIAFSIFFPFCSTTIQSPCCLLILPISFFPHSLDSVINNFLSMFIFLIIIIVYSVSIHSGVMCCVWC